MKHLKSWTHIINIFTVGISTTVFLYLVNYWLINQGYLPPVKIEEYCDMHLSASVWSFIEIMGYSLVNLIYISKNRFSDLTNSD